MAATSGDRARSDLADAIERSRPRRPGDADDVPTPVAATVILVRDGRAGPEVLMIERPDRGSFAGAWVFPGGKVEASDARTPTDAEADVARQAGVRETREESGLGVDPDALLTLSVWDPPPGLAVRIRTWFFVAQVRGDEMLELSPDEAVAAQWVTPADALARHGRGELLLYPPTWVTLYGLSAYARADTLMDAVRLGGVHRYETVARRTPGGPMLLWQDDAEYGDESGDAASGARHRLEIGALPWIYLRR